MKRTFLGTVALALAILGGGATGFAANTAAVNEVLKLKTAGLGEETILSFIKSKVVNYDLASDDVLSLNQQGVSSAVINAMLASGKNTSPAPVAPAVPVTVNVPAPAPVAVAAPTSVWTAPAPADAAATTFTAPAATPNNPGTPPATLNPEAAYFYQELSPYGRWLLAEDNQWYWQPTVAQTSLAWRPYSDNGHWIASDSGWYWSSDYPWGWAAFHYGRWELHPHHGWIWQPDRMWGPGWVTWRSGGDYCGWAPLPPGAVFDVSAGRLLFHGRAVSADFDFGLGWMNFNFCYVRELGEPLRWRPANEVEIRSVFDRTKVIVSYRSGRSMINGEMRDHFINVGIETGRVAELRGRPVELVRVQDLHEHGGPGVHERLNPGAHTLEIYRPHFGRKGERRYE